MKQDRQRNRKKYATRQRLQLQRRRSVVGGIG
jgi:hypothetical protein